MQLYFTECRQYVKNEWTAECPAKTAVPGGPAVPTGAAECPAGTAVSIWAGTAKRTAAILPVRPAKFPTAILSAGTGRWNNKGSRMA